MIKYKYTSYIYIYIWLYISFFPGAAESSAWSHAFSGQNCASPSSSPAVQLTWTQNPSGRDRSSPRPWPVMAGPWWKMSVVQIVQQLPQWPNSWLQGRSSLLLYESDPRSLALSGPHEIPSDEGIYRHSPNAGWRHATREVSPASK